MTKRTKWKGFYNDEKFLKNFQDLKKINIIKKVKRHSSILPKFVGKIVTVHSGKTFNKLTIIKNMIGHKFGEFIPTRTKFTFKKKKKKTLEAVLKKELTPLNY